MPEKINTHYIYFGSSTKVKMLSNFYKCDIEYQGEKYNSTEHAYQSLKFIKEDRIRFTKNGDLGNYESIKKYGNIFYGKKITDEELDKKIEYWEKKKCIGIVAKMSSNIKYSKRLGLTYDENCDYLINYEKFKEILKIKYNIEKFKNLLQKTKGRMIIEFGKGAKRLHEKNINEKWGGLVDNGILYGENTMGKWLMEIRDQITEE